MRLLTELRSRNPKLAEQIEAGLYSIEQLSEVSGRGMQVLLQEVEHQDLLLSLKTASKDVWKLVLANLSKRKRDMVVSDFELLPPTPMRDVEAAQRRVMAVLEELRKAGRVPTADPNDVWV